MNEDQLIDAAEREIDLYRGEVARVTAERDKYRGELENAIAVMLLSRDTADAALAIRERTGLLPLKPAPERARRPVADRHLP